MAWDGELYVCLECGRKSGYRKCRPCQENECIDTGFDRSRCTCSRCTAERAERNASRCGRCDDKLAQGDSALCSPCIEDLGRT